MIVTWGEFERRAPEHAAAGRLRFQFTPTDPIFHLRIERCHWALWENAGKPNMRPIRRPWSPG
jgi:hypothetical protein